MIQKTEKIMGTEIEILIPKNQKNFSHLKIEKEIQKVFQVFRDLESQFSRFLSTSELSLLNAKKKMVVSDNFLQVLEFSLSLARKTHGIFNPLVSLSSLGYSTDFAQKKFEKISPQKQLSSHLFFSKISDFFGRFFPEKNNIAQNMKNFLDFKSIKIDEKKREITLPKNSNLDLGGCVKGYAVDKATEILDKNFSNFLINAGGDIFARGKYKGEKWIVGVANPINEEKDIFLIELSNEALATSGSYRRKWTIQNESYHHIVSGNTNTNIFTNLSSVTVQASSCILADSFATTCFLLGEKKGRKFLVKNNAMGYFY